MVFPKYAQNAYENIRNPSEISLYLLQKTKKSKKNM